MSKPKILEMKEKIAEVEGKITELKEELEGEIVYESEEGTNTDVTLSDTTEDADGIEIFFDNDRSVTNGERIFSSIKVMKPNGKYVTLETSKVGSTYVYRDGQEYQIVGNKLNVVHFYNSVFNGNTVSTNIDHQGFIRVFKVVKYKKKTVENTEDTVESEEQ